MNRNSAQENFNLTKGFKSYVSKPEITDLAPNFLVKGSKNVLVDYANRVISRFGYTLYRAAAADGSSGVKGSFDWDTSTAKSFSLRSWGQVLEFDWNGAYNTLVSGLATPYLNFAKIWDNTEKIDVLIFVLGIAGYYKWSGGVARVRSTTGTTLTKQGVLSGTTFAFVAGTPGTVAGTVTDSSNSFVDAGFAAGDTLYVSGSVSNNRNFTIGSVTAGTITLVITDIVVNEAAGATVLLHSGEPTWASARFFTSVSGRSITYNGVSYTYTGGETTATLTGLTAFPAVTAGDPVWQDAVYTVNPVAITAGFKQDLVGVQINQLIFASTKSLEIFISASPDYTNFALTSPRVPGDPAKVNMDNFPTCIIPIDNNAQTASSLLFGGGTSEFFKLNYTLAQDNSSELVRMIKLKSAIGSGLISGSAIGNIKNMTAYINRDPALDTIGNIESPNDHATIPLSDPIKDDFDAYNFAGAHLKYWKRAIYIALPAEGLVLIYDLMRQLWQPPQTIPVSRLAIIGDWLYGHSSVSAETYKLFDGTNDNGNYIAQVARFAYNNGGDRNMIKRLNEYWTDGYISSNGVLQVNQRFGYNGSIGANQTFITGNDDAVTSPIDADPLGSDPLGSDPLGGAVSGDQSTSTSRRFYQVDTYQSKDYIEQFVEYTMDSIDGRFAIVAHGSNQWDAGTAHLSHKK